MAHEADNKKVRRSVEEQMTGIVENVLSMIGSVEHGGIYLLFFQHTDKSWQKIIRVTNRVVIGIHQVIPVFSLCFHRIIGRKESIFRRVTFAIVKVGTVGVKYDELFRCTFRQFLLHQFQKFVVRRIIGRTDRIFFIKSYVSASIPKKSINEWL